MPRILRITVKNLKEIVKEIVESIKEGKVVVCPTDTVYGLLADATNKIAVEKLFKIKKRPKNKTVSVFVKDLRMAKRIAKIDKKQEKFLKKVWPGKTTAILKAKRKFPKGIVCPKGKIGIRIPNHKTINHLLLAIGRPLTGTSANISGKPASTKIKEVINQFASQKNKPDLIISAGNLLKSKPSKVIDLTIQPPKILRQ